MRGGGGGITRNFHKQRGETNNFSAASRGDQKLNRVFHPVSTTPPPRELKNDNSLTAFELINQLPYINFPSFECRFCYKDLTSTLSSSVALCLVTSLITLLGLEVSFTSPPPPSWFLEHKSKMKEDFFLETL